MVNKTAFTKDATEDQYGYDSVDGWFYTWITSAYQNTTPGEGEGKRVREFIVKHGKHNGYFNSIQRAIDYVEPGDRVLIHHGTYFEELILDKYVELHGDGEVILESRGEATIICRSKSGCDIRSLLIKCKNTSGTAISVFEGTARISECFVQGMDVHGNETHAGSVQVRKCTFSGSQRCGVQLRGEASAKIDACDIRKNKEASVSVTSTGEIEFIGCTIGSSHSRTILISGCMDESSQRTKPQPKFYACHIEDAGYHAPSVTWIPKTHRSSLSSKFTLNPSLIDDHSAVTIVNGAAPGFERCNIVSDNGNGVTVLSSSPCFSNHCIISACGGFGVVISSSTISQANSSQSFTPIFEDCRIENNEKGGIVLVSDPAAQTPKTITAKLRRTVIEANKGPGLLLTGSAVEIDAMGNDVRDHDDASTSPGIAVVNGATGIFEENQVKQNSLGVFIETGGNPVMLSNEMFANTVAVDCSSHAKGRFEKNTFTRNGWSGNYAVVVRRSADPVFENDNLFLRNGPTKRNTTEGKVPPASSSSSGPGAGSILVTSFGRGRFANNSIMENESLSPQIAVQKGGNPIFTSNTISRGQGIGVLCASQGFGTFTSNTISDNGTDNVHITSNSDPVFLKNTVKGSSGGYGVRVGGSLGVFRENDIEQNSIGGVRIESHTGHCSFVKNNIRKQFRGVVVVSRSSVIFEKNVITQNGVNIELDGSDDDAEEQPDDDEPEKKPTPIFKRNTITEPIYHAQVDGFPFSGVGTVNVWGHGRLACAIFTQNHFTPTNEANLGTPSVYLASTSDLTFCRNTFTGNESGQGVVFTEKATGTFEDNTLHGGFQKGAVSLFKGSNPRIAKNDVKNSCKGASGIHCGEGAAGEVTENTVKSSISGVTLEGSDGSLIKGNWLEGNEHGVCCLTGSSGSVVGNDISRNTLSGVLVQGLSAVEFTQNDIHNEKIGVIAQRDARNIFDNNSIKDCTGCCVEIHAGSSPTILKNTLFRSTVGVLCASKDANGILIENKIYHCTTGVLISLEANPRMEANTIGDPREGLGNTKGIHVIRDGKGEIVSNYLVGNSKGLCVDTKGSPDVKGNTFEGTNEVQAGLWIGDEGLGVYTQNNKFTNHAGGCGAVVDGEGANPTFDDAVFEQNNVGLKCVNGGGHFTNCKFSKGYHHCVEVAGNANPAFVSCQVVDNPCGVSFSGSARSSWRHTTFTNHLSIKISQQANPSIEDCTFVSDPKQPCTTGIACEKGGTGSIQRCLFSRLLDFGITIQTKANPLIKECEFTFIEKAGICVEMGGRGVVENCVIKDNQHVGISVSGTDSAPLVDSNIISDNDIGFKATHSCQGTYTNNRVLRHARGVVIAYAGNPEFSQNQITDNEIGVAVHTNGLGFFRKNQILGNRSCGLFVSDKGQPTIQLNKVTQNGLSPSDPESTTVPVGGLVFNSGDGTVQDNVFDNNAPKAILIIGESNPSISRNVLSGSSVGIAIEGGKGVITNNSIRGITEECIVICTAGDPTVTGNSIHGGVYGILIKSHGLGNYTQNVISGTEIAGVVIGSYAGPKVDRNYIVRNQSVNRSYGVLVKAAARGEVGQNILFQNDIGIYTEGDETTTATPHNATTSIVKNEVTANTIGIRCCGIGSLFESNTISKSHVGVEVLNGGRPVFVQNSIFDCKVGFEITQNGGGTIDSNKICSNYDGIVLRGTVHSSCLMTGNEIAGNEHTGVSYAAATNGVMKNNNVLYQNGGKERGCGVLIEGINGSGLPDGEPLIQGVIITSHRVGVLFKSARAIVSELNVSRCTEVGVRISQNSKPILLKSDVYDNASTGVEITTGGGGELRECNIVENTGSSLFIGHYEPGSLQLKLKQCNVFYPSISGIVGAINIDRSSSIRQSEFSAQQDQNVIRNDLRFGGPWHTSSPTGSAVQQAAARKELVDRDQKLHSTMLDLIKKSKKTYSEPGTALKVENFANGLQKNYLSARVLTELIELSLEETDAGKILLSGTFFAPPKPAALLSPIVSAMATKLKGISKLSTATERKKKQITTRVASMRLKKAAAADTPDTTASKARMICHGPKEGILTAHVVDELKGKGIDVKSLSTQDFSTDKSVESALKFFQDKDVFLVVLSTSLLKEGTALPNELAIATAAQLKHSNDLRIVIISDEYQFIKKHVRDAWVRQTIEKNGVLHVPRDEDRVGEFLKDLEGVVLGGLNYGKIEAKWEKVRKLEPVREPAPPAEILHKSPRPAKRPEMLHRPAISPLSELASPPGTPPPPAPLSPTLSSTLSTARSSAGVETNSMHSPMSSEPPMSPSASLEKFPPVFICCSSAEAPNICSLLRAVVSKEPGLTGCFTMWEGHKTGKEYNQYLRDAHQRCDAAVAFVSKEFIGSRQAVKEFDKMTNNGLRFRPLCFIEVDDVASSDQIKPLGTLLTCLERAKTEDCYARASSFDWVDVRLVADLCNFVKTHVQNKRETATKLSKAGICVSPQSKGASAVSRLAFIKKLKHSPSSQATDVPVYLWSADDVDFWLSQTLQLPQYSSLLKASGFDGSALLSAKKVDLMSIGIMDSKIISTILEEVGKMKP